MRFLISFLCLPTLLCASSTELDQYQKDYAHRNFKSKFHQIHFFIPDMIVPIIGCCELDEEENLIKVVLTINGCQYTCDKFIHDDKNCSLGLDDIY